MGPRLRLNSRTEVNIAADQRIGGRKTKKTRSGSSSGIETPGTRLTRKPASTCRIGVGTGSRLASAVSATTSAATAIANRTGWKWGIQAGGSVEVPRGGRVESPEAAEPAQPRHHR